MADPKVMNYLFKSSSGRLEDLSQLEPLGKRLFISSLHLILNGDKKDDYEAKAVTVKYIMEVLKAKIPKQTIYRHLEDYGPSSKSKASNSFSFKLPLPSKKSGMNKDLLALAINQCGKHHIYFMATILNVNKNTLKNWLKKNVDVTKSDGAICIFCNDKLEMECSDVSMTSMTSQANEVSNVDTSASTVMNDTIPPEVIANKNIENIDSLRSKYKDLQDYYTYCGSYPSIVNTFSNAYNYMDLFKAAQKERSVNFIMYRYILVI